MKENEIRTRLKVSSEEIVEIIDTHISWVVLTRDFAYKIKKPVTFPFVDFAHISQRKHFCEKELELNRRLAPSVYLEVKPILHTMEGHFVIDAGEGEIVDYCVQMTKLDTDRQMHLLLEQEAVQRDHIVEIAKIVSDFHQNATIIWNSFSKTSRKEWFNDIDSVRELAGKYLGAASVDSLDDLISYSDNFLDRYERSFVSRHKGGMIRDVHGDLHAGNIFLLESPVIFDCIEFSEAFRQIDLLDEIGFFCMDLEAFDRTDLSELFLKSYLNNFPGVFDTENAMTIFRYYKLYRANVRAKVTLLKIEQHQNEKAVAQSLTKEAQIYFDLMSRYMEELHSMMDA